MCGTASELQTSQIQIYEFSLNRKAFLARFNNRKDAESYRKRHMHLLDLDMKLKLVGGL